MAKRSSLGNVSTKELWIAELARRLQGKVITTLSHHMDVEWLREAYRRTRKDGAVGVDNQTAAEYEAELEENLTKLLDRVKSGRYRAPAVKRAYIPKGEGKEKRPIGIPTLEDKVLQRAVVMLLEPIYEQEFAESSYGFRPKRNPHQALRKVWEATMQVGGGVVIEVDIRKCFDSFDHNHLQTIVRQRVRDGVIVRLIGKWLNAGVLEGGVITYPSEGTPQGGVISPLLANIYLHEVLDAWWEETVKPRLKGKAELIRYADDFVIVCADEYDARRVLEALPKRCGKYGLTLHPEKTGMVPFWNPKSGKRPGVFDFLGFQHYWSRSRKGNWVVRQKTAPTRFRRSLRRIRAWCRENRHEPLAVQHRILGQKVRGHYGYFGVVGNYRALARYVYAVTRIWHTWLERRGQRGKLTWERFNELLKIFPLPRPRIMVRVCT